MNVREIPLFLLAFTIETVVSGALLLPLLRRLHVRQHAYEDAPQTHQAKSGTPTMGGLVFLVPLATLFFAFRRHDALFDALFFLIVVCAGIGFLDDYMSLVRGRNLGLRGRTKFLATALVAIIFMRWVGDSTIIFPRDTIMMIGTWNWVAPHWFWLILGIIAVTSTIHAVNLTDGLDGLATGVILPPLAVFFMFAFYAYANIPLRNGSTSAGVPLILLAMMGGCLGFLVYNRHPAKLFMGDTGSLALGATLSGAAILTGQMMLLILIGGVFVAEAVSVIIQVTYFKRTKKRVFRMSPLHHHFELGGWPETKVTSSFWIASAILSFLGWAVSGFVMP